ncbi:ABC transporter substrate-binding protein [Actinoplanes sp. ATCC 53533]|uniref:ABC transporter substrate-binding protein n=1 Tax=Actinoplanes sp. ATCC 53533 TaxID=1288362 RepID=UPI000F792B8F|nr:sugar ABC transporter substrate-binding protein [Actinoplanes sp. ATCC 53533]RSM74139.1 ABC transporter substrate-binding protein [Actinoplanes sp. ATCC 53533]
MRKRYALISALLALPLAVSACSADAAEDADSASGEVSYWLWDANQQPAYQQCATDFTAKNPKITVKISQKGWDDYWSAITTGMVSGTAPDVFTDHLSKYTDFFTKHQVLPLDDLVARDNVSTASFEAGLAELWVGSDGKRYGLPKDWDTVGVFHNKKLTDAAGLTPEQLGTLAWNPTDGGTYEKAIAHLTVDKNGKRGDEAGFDKGNVKTYGLWMNSSGSGFGQTEWSMYALSNGWTATDKNPWGTHYNYDSPKFQETIKWWKSLIDKGYMPTLANSTGLDGLTQLAAGKVALATNGDWNTSAVFGNKSATFEPAVAPTPVGPTGKRASVFNGLADSIYAGTKHKEAAWQWVKYLASADCQNVVAEKAVVFPAIPAASEVAAKAFAAKGANVDAFTVHVKDKTTALPWITAHAADIDAIMKPAMDAVMSGKAEVDSLTKANTDINALFTG